MSRREFLLGGGAIFFASGCKSVELSGRPNLRFGVVSDIHLVTPKTGKMFERALCSFKGYGVDAVMVPGDVRGK